MVNLRAQQLQVYTAQSANNLTITIPSIHIAESYKLRPIKLFYCTANNVTSNTRVVLGGILGGAPCLP